jgi:alpha-methylacyl-CoA racemase
MKPLEGVKVLDLTTLLPGPLTGHYLALLGAEVIKIEPPTGDLARNFPQLFNTLNKNKRSINLNFKSQQDRDQLYELVKDSDILLENYKPGTTEKLKIQYDTLFRFNKKLVYCSLIGFQEGHELHEYAGHDINFLGLSGLLSLMKNKENNTIQLPNFQLADIAAGTYPALSAIFCGLYQAEKNDKGAHVSVSLMENLKPLYTFISKSLKDSEQNYSNVLSGEQACYGIYQTKDKTHMCLGAFEERFFKIFLTKIGLTELTDSHLKKNYKSKNVKQIIADKIKTQTQSHWVSFFKDIDCCFSPVLPPSEFKLVPPFYYSEDGEIS